MLRANSRIPLGFRISSLALEWEQVFRALAVLYRRRSYNISGGGSSSSISNGCGSGTSSGTSDSYFRSRLQLALVHLIKR